MGAFRVMVVMWRTLAWVPTPAVPATLVSTVLVQTPAKAVTQILSTGGPRIPTTLGCTRPGSPRRVGRGVRPVSTAMGESWLRSQAFPRSRRMVDAYVTTTTRSSLTTTSRSGRRRLRRPSAQAVTVAIFGRTSEPWSDVWPPAASSLRRCAVPHILAALQRHSTIGVDGDQ